jgi:hypothetical protein
MDTALARKFRTSSAQRVFLATVGNLDHSIRVPKRTIPVAIMTFARPESARTTIWSAARSA